MTDVSAVEVKQQEPIEVADFKFYTLDDYLALPREPVPWLIKHLVPAGGLMNIYGKPKLGKSYAALGIADAIANPECTQFLGKDVLKHGSVIYLQVDTPRNDWAKRGQDLKEAGYKFHYGENKVYFTDANLVPYPLNVLNDVILAGLKKKVLELKPLILVIDTLREVHEEDEDKSKEMKKVITALVQATKETGTTLILISHARKDNPLATEDNLMDDARGSSYIPGRMDVIAKLTEKKLLLAGRSIGKGHIDIEQDEHHMLVVNNKKQEEEAALKHVLSNSSLSVEEQAKLLSALTGTEHEAAKKRIYRYKKKTSKEG